MRYPPLSKGHRLLADLAQGGHMNVHFSQWGEDVVLWHFLRERRGGFYVDVGAHHPHSLSNTAALHHFNGWSGINIDADERAIRAFHSARPHDINLCVGVGGENGTQQFAIFEDGAVNSLDPASVDNQITKAGKKLIGYRAVQVRTLRDILNEHVSADRSIDLLNVDAEGLDTIVLESNDWSRHAPKFIAVEDHSMNLMDPNGSATFALLRGHDYRLIAHTIATSIYAHG